MSGSAVEVGTSAWGAPPWPLGVARLDAAGRFVEVNDVLAGWHGLPVGEHIGRTLPDAVPDLVGDLQTAVAEVLAGGRGRDGVRVHRQGRTGSGWVASVRPWPDPDGDGVTWAALELPATRDGDAGVFASAAIGAERRRSDVMRRLGLIAKAGKLMSTSLEPADTLASLCDLVVPELADHAFVDVVDDGLPRRAAIRHADGTHVGGAPVRPVGDVAHYPAGHPVLAVLDGGENLLVRDLAEGDPRVPPGTDADLVTGLGVRSLMVLPMRAGDATLGTVVLATSTSGRRFDTEDLQLARTMVDRAAVAVANALRYAEQRAAAVQLQRSLLPRTLSDVDGLDVGWHYAPGTDGTEVGGDWVDVVELPGGRIAVVVGDVMGRGLRAAAVMGQLRAAVRALAVADPPPSDLLSRLDAIVESLGDDQIVTCVYAVFDPARGQITLANAGHLPPLLLLDGRVYPLEGMSGVPLGVGGVPFTEREAPLPAGAVLALYTDGLVERRGGDLDAAVQRLADRLQSSTGDLGARCKALVDAASRDQEAGFGDDVALLLVRARQEPHDVARHVGLEAVAESVGAARRFAVGSLHTWGLDDDALADTVRLVVSELVTNAVRYSGGRDVDVLVRRARGAVLVEVSDRDTRTPRMRHASMDEEGGRGLAMVQALATGWGTRATMTGKVVWCRLDVPATG